MPPNIVVVVADTTRADDALTPEIAPTLAELGDDGSRAPEAFATAPWTLPSHASMLTGSHPTTHGAHADHEHLGEEPAVLPELLSEAGYETVCVSNNTWLSAESGFERGFDEFQQMWQLVQSDTALGEVVQITDESRAVAVARRLFDGNPVVNAANAAYQLLTSDDPDDGAQRTTAWIEDWLRERSSDRPFFLLANYIEPHLEYDPPRRLAEQYLPADATYEEAMAVPQEPWEYLAGGLELSDRDFELLRGLYRAEIAYVDEQLAALRDVLLETGEFEDTLLVVTGDHGENVGDHGLMDHQYCLWDTLIHVPLVFHGAPFDGDDVEGLVSLADLAPTLLEVAGVDPDDALGDVQGRSIHPDAGGADREFVVSEYVAPMPSMDALERNLGDLPDHVYELDRSLRAIRTPEYKLVRASDGSEWLYDLTDDPGETTDVSEGRPSVVEDLGSRLDDWLQGIDRRDRDDRVTISDDRKARLEQLGYLQ